MKEREKLKPLVDRSGIKCKEERKSLEKRLQILEEEGRKREREQRERWERKTEEMETK